MSDFVILKAMEQRSRWRSLHQLIPMDTLVPDARALLGWLKVYYETYPDKEHLEHSLLLSLIKTKVSMPMEQWTPLKATVDRLAAFDDAEAVQGIVNNLLERDLAGRAGAIIDRYEEGQEIALVQQLKSLVQDTSRQVENSSAGTYIDEDIGDILADQGTDRGLKLPTRLLKDHVSGLLGGDTLMVAARVDKGKSSLLAAICAEFAPQIKEYFGDRPILWLNNEGPGRRIYLRIYSAALAKTSTELVEMYQAGTLVEEYNKAVHGCSIRVKDIHGASLAQIEQTIEAMQPCVVIVDMMANVRSAAVQGGNKTDALEATWQGLRELAVMYDFIGIGTAQISTEGDDTLYPGYGAIKDSKTAAQGAVDVMLMLGALNDPQYQTIRGLSTPKNKSARPGFPSHAQGEVHFDAQRCQFTDGE